MLRIIVFATTLTVPTAGFAETNLERMERLTSVMTDKMYAHIETIYPAAKGNLPDPGWDDNIRAAAECSLDEYYGLIGNDGVVAMMDEMETVLAEDIGDFEEWIEGMEFDTGITDAQSSSIEAKCGMGKATTDKMMADPKMPNLMQAMAAAFEDG